MLSADVGMRSRCRSVCTSVQWENVCDFYLADCTFLYRSKYAFIVLEVLAIGTTLLSLCIMPKSVIRHEWFMVCHWFHSYILRNEDKALGYKASHDAYKDECKKQTAEVIQNKEGKDYSDEDIMVSIEECVLITPVQLGMLTEGFPQNPCCECYSHHNHGNSLVSRRLAVPPFCHTLSW
jgi:hypothetical protein